MRRIQYLNNVIGFVNNVIQFRKNVTQCSISLGSIGIGGKWDQYIILGGLALVHL